MYVDKLSTFHDQGICSSVQNAAIFTIGQTQLEPRQDEDEGKCFYPRMGSLFQRRSQGTGINSY